MHTSSFAITKEGLVYHWDVHEWIYLGHISCLAREETPLGYRVRAWWHARLASNEPCENLVVPGGREKPYLVRTSGSDEPANSVAVDAVDATGATVDTHPPEEHMPLLPVGVSEIHPTCLERQLLPPFGEPCDLLS